MGSGLLINQAGQASEAILLKPSTSSSVSKIEKAAAVNQDATVKGGRFR
jgi:hypothetical protein